MTGHTTVRVNDDLAAGEAGVRGGAAQDEATRRVDQSGHGSGRQRETGRLDDRGNDVVAHRVGDRRLRQRLVVLGGHDDRVDTHRPTVFVREGHLSLAVGTQPFNDALLANVSQTLCEAVCQPDGGGHEIRGIRRSVAEHDALVAGAETVARVTALGAAHFNGFINAAGDVGALAVQRYGNAAGGTVEANARRVVANRKNLATHNLRNLNVRLGRHLTGDVDEAGGRHRLDGNARAGVGSEQRVEDRIGDTVTDLVGVTFGNGLRRKKLLTHRFRLSRNEAIWPTRPAATSSFEPT